MRLFALRGANSVERNEAGAILDATDKLMRELMARNELEAERIVSCIFTLTDDLDAEFPAVAARRVGLDRVPLLCAREVPVPGSMPRVIRTLVHYYAPEDHEPRDVYLGEARSLRADLDAAQGLMSLEFAQRIRRMPVYPVASGYELGTEVAMLASNESCFGPLPAVVEAAGAVLSGANRYPDPEYSPLRRALSDRYGLAPERIALGNGSCDILLAAGEALLEPGAEVVYSWPAFSMYPHLAAASGARALEVALDTEDRHDLDAMAAEVTVATRLVLVCNPNNPTSTALGLDEIEQFLEQVPRHVCVILDEAYVEYSLALGDPYASVELLRRWPNLVLLRTFSKVYGLAGLRAGYALCGAPEFRAAVDQLRQPFHLNVAAQAAAVEALRYQDEVERRVTQTIASRLALSDAVEQIGLWVAESDANFIWVRLPEDGDEGELVKGLLERGVLVRAGGSLGRAGYIRVTVGTDPENRRFVAALGELV